MCYLISKIRLIFNLSDRFKLNHIFQRSQRDHHVTSLSTRSFSISFNSLLSNALTSVPSFEHLQFYSSSYYLFFFLTASLFFFRIVSGTSNSRRRLYGTVQSRFLLFPSIPFPLLVRKEILYNTGNDQVDRSIEISDGPFVEYVYWRIYCCEYDS